MIKFYLFAQVKSGFDFDSSSPHGNAFI